MFNLSINYSKNPEIREILGHKEIGDTCKFEVEIQIVERDENEVRATIKEIEFDGDYPVGADGKEKGPTKPNADEPVMVVITAARSKKSKAEAESPVYDY